MFKLNIKSKTFWIYVLLASNLYFYAMWHDAEYEIRQIYDSTIPDYSSAVFGNPSAQLEVANKFYAGQTAPRNLKTAIYWYKKAAHKRKMPFAEYMLGYLYSKGDILGTNVSRDEKEALYWFERAAAHEITDLTDSTDQKAWLGTVRAQEELALINEKKNSEVAFYWYQKAAINGSQSARKRMVEIYTEGLLKVKKNTSKALYWKNKSSEKPLIKYGSLGLLKPINLAI